MTKFRHSVRPVHIAELNNPARPTRPRFGEGPRAPHKAVVYYVRFADLVKIGTTHNMVQRLNALPHDGLMSAA